MATTSLDELIQKFEALTLSENDTSDTSRCIFFRLPLEIQTMIFAMNICWFIPNLFTHMLVCRRWQEIIVGTPSFWRRLSLTKKTTLSGLKTWMDRANGRIDYLEVTHGLDVPGAWKLLAELHLEDIWSTLMDLEIRSRDPIDSALWPQEVRERLHYKGLVLDGRYGFLRLRYTMDARRLVRHYPAFLVSRSALPLAFLTRLELYASFGNRPIFTLLQDFRQLEQLYVSSSRKWSDDFTWDDPPTPVEHGNLLDLHLTDCHDSDLYVRGIRFPNLRCFSLRKVDCNCGARSVEALASQRLIHLTRLCIEATGFYEGDMVSILCNAAALRLLILPRNEILGESRGAVVYAALANQVRRDGEFLQASKPFCPRLKRLDLSDNEMLEREHITKIVEARLQEPRDSKSTDMGSSSQDDTQVNVLPIRKLGVKGCSKIDLETVEWLKAKVKRVTA